ncbi:MAG TPA: hypothetical protein PKE46_02440 [Micropruina sp.]|nr:hypothetical protein [Micropruina sp.]HMR20972.1 hypothetical protein [Micropruina sp.]
MRVEELPADARVPDWVLTHTHTSAGERAYMYHDPDPEVDATPLVVFERAEQVEVLPLFAARPRLAQMMPTSNYR